MASVLLVDRRVAFRQALAFLLEQEQEFDVIDQVSVLEDRRLFTDIDVAVISVDAHNGGLEQTVYENVDVRRGVLALTGSDHPLSADPGAERVLRVVSASCGLDDLLVALRNLVLPAV